MDIKTDFDLWQKVKILDADILGRVSEISYSSAGVLYKVEHWVEGKLEYVWMHGVDLAPQADKKPAGIGKPRP